MTENYTRYFCKTSSKSANQFSISSFSNRFSIASKCYQITGTESICNRVHHPRIEMYRRHQALETLTKAREKKAENRQSRDSILRLNEMFVQWLTMVFPGVLTSPDRFLSAERMRALCGRPRTVPGVGRIMYYLTPTKKDPRAATGGLGYLIHPPESCSSRYSPGRSLKLPDEES